MSVVYKLSSLRHFVVAAQMDKDSSPLLMQYSSTDALISRESWLSCVNVRKPSTISCVPNHEGSSHWCAADLLSAKGRDISWECPSLEGALGIARKTRDCRRKKGSHWTYQGGKSRLLNQGGRLARLQEQRTVPGRNRGQIESKYLVLHHVW
jgi:hypothetical protein